MHCLKLSCFCCRYVAGVTLTLFVFFPTTGVVLWGPMAVVAAIVAQISWGLVLPACECGHVHF